MEIFISRVHSDDASLPPADPGFHDASHVVDDQALRPNDQPGQLDDGFVQSYISAASFAVVGL
jgi:hypothetical protein